MVPIEFEMIYDRNANNIYIGDKSENLRNDKSFVIDFGSELLYVAWADREDRYYGQQRKRYVAEVPLRKLNDESIEKIKKINEIESIQSVSYHTGKQQVKTLIASDSLSQVIKTIFYLTNMA